MPNILVQPQQLRQTAEQLRSHAQKIDQALHAIDNDIRSLKGHHFLGRRADTVQAHYAPKRDALLNANELVLRFSEELKTAASTFEHADQIQTADRRTDRRVDRRIESDRRWRRSDEKGGDHWDYDWAGGAILERYLEGGDDWIINNDPRWTKYMQENQSLTQSLKIKSLETARLLFESGNSTISIDETFAMQMENGEGIVGYQYLHGTNEHAGGFERDGTATITQDADGNYTVTMKMEYTWNDIIDPNPQYHTDNWKNAVAEVITLGKADPYEIHIGWSETTIMKLDSYGNVLSINNP